MIASLYMLFNTQRSPKAIFVTPKIHANIVRMQVIFQATLEKIFWEKSPSPHLQCWKSCRSGHLRQKCMSVPTLCKGEGALLKFFLSEGNSQIFFPPLSQILKQFGNIFRQENQTFHNLIFVLKVIETNINFDL